MRLKTGQWLSLPQPCTKKSLQDGKKVIFFSSKIHGAVRERVCIGGRRREGPVLVTGTRKDGNERSVL